MGGVQEVMRQIAERMVNLGHEVTIATTRLSTRDFDVLNGVVIKEFAIHGNLVTGIKGEIEDYRNFVLNFSCDAILIKAAQQWTFDAIWPILDLLKARKVFIPCGFLSFYEEEYQEYFKSLPSVMRKFDHLIFYSNNYRDINYARSNLIANFTVLPNGASEVEFGVAVDPSFRSRHKIPEDSFLILTVGALSGAKGHLEVAKAVELISTNDEISLLLNGNNPYINSINVNGVLSQVDRVKCIANIYKKFKKIIILFGRNSFNPCKVLKDIRRILKEREEESLSYFEKVSQCIKSINSSGTHKKAILVDLPRKELIQAYLAADLFVFASHVEYSPLVLFEAAASATPFITSRAGNAEEIIEWLGGGFVMADSEGRDGFRAIDPQSLAHEISLLIGQRSLLKSTGHVIQENWRSKFTWKIIAAQYEQILLNEKSSGTC